ncbi:phage replisome organizer N-terminal domain-containing protein [Enterococcus raffinosus]|uniref:phage replisome organizer N-terminal domain-containing protein n=1 Tax=Enterococcus raffinosus TaxID=71452 RepID=UPI0028920673|nr:phage replisome organizer N-terminal domain-containing protein [Enterococcus raffinosus]MDT2525895.1 phage replisome organizer N-terminal domain-containing protein [Enterococcus raffinosus]MDT2536403.1 phage replisome organizer N-terminal domain-containing protein [Enterococcus raffinosus]MDT2593177.1 phage replisome organizer N-terminal domain-containing protein [Enterococcus raffinosus]
MADNKKYYYLKLKDNFFDSDEMIILESMPDGYLYSNILLKLYLRSLKHEGRLMFNDKIPFNSTMLAQVTRHTIGNVEKAIQIFRDLSLIEVLDNGAIYLADIQNFIGESSTEADRKRLYRQRIEKEKRMLLPERQMSDKCPDKTPPEIELEIEKELEIKKESRKSRKRIYDDDSPYLQLARQLYKKINDNGPIKEPNLQNWADDIRKMVELDDREISKVGRMIEWCQKDTFWSSNILSAKKLREKYDVMARQANRKPERGYNKPKGRVEELPSHIAKPPKNVEISPERQAELDRKLAEYLNKEENG